MFLTPLTWKHKATFTPQAVDPSSVLAVHLQDVYRHDGYQAHAALAGHLEGLF